MKILISGGAGFIGSFIAERYLELGHEVHIIDNLSTGLRENLPSGAKFYELDITSPEVWRIFERERFDALSHQAAQMNVRRSVGDPLHDARTNIIGSLNLYEACLKYEVKKVIFSSSAGTIYGVQREYPCGESHPQNPISPYGIAKLTNERYLQYYEASFGLNYTALRYANVFGPRQNPHGEAGVIAIFAEKLFKGERPLIFGEGEATRDYVYISDVVRANELALNPGMRGAYNVSTGTERSVNQIFEDLKKATGSPLEAIKSEVKKGELERNSCSYAKIEREWGWRPEVGFEEGMKPTVEFFRNKALSGK